MKIALYIEDGLEQIVLTPESDSEHALLGKLHDGSRDLGVYRGKFYECRGGWVRHTMLTEPTIYDGPGQVPERYRDDSTMIVLRPKKAEPPKEEWCPAKPGQKHIPGECAICDGERT